MGLARHRGLLAISTALVLGLPVAWFLSHRSASATSAIVVPVKQGEFKVTVTTSGELRARKFVQIAAPSNAQQAEAYQMKIASLVPEGTLVKAGDIVAELDRSGLATKLTEVSTALQKAEAVYEQAMLDSTLNLSKAREEIRTMELGLEEKKLAKEQAVYEAPTVKRQAEIDFEKAERALAQAKVDYKTKTEQAQAKMREVGADLDRQKSKLQVVQDVMQGFTIKAPAPGMVIYVKEWSGKKRTVGSQVSPWEPTVATLPDLTQLESITYVNEIDVRKIAVGQPAAITLDADPTKRLTGTVTSVANVGEQRPNTDAKVFEVRVAIAQVDTTLRPGMTTGNVIETHKTAQALSVPLEAVSSESGVPIVYKQGGSQITKQEIVTGEMNDESVIVTRGLTATDRVLLSPPAERDKLELHRLSGSAVAPPASPPASGDTARPTVPLVPRSDSGSPSSSPKRLPRLPARPAGA
jgi:multidrug efflux pump subunit AcrA (membrane-fusion protein)